MHSHTHHHEAHDDHSHSVDFDNINISFMIAVVANLGFTILEAVFGFIAKADGLSVVQVTLCRESP